MELKGRGEKVKEEQGGRERRKGRADYPAEAALLELQTRRRPPCTLSPHLISKEPFIYVPAHQVPDHRTLKRPPYPFP